jgi:hypothetical protein
MTPIASAAAQAAATLPLFLPSPRPDTASSLLQAATTLMEALAKGQALDAHALRAAMEAAFGASDAAGAWDWKLGYEACEAAQILFLRKFGPAMHTRAGSPAAFLAMLGKLAALAPSQTRRSEIFGSITSARIDLIRSRVPSSSAPIEPAGSVVESGSAMPRIVRAEIVRAVPERVQSAAAPTATVALPLLLNYLGSMMVPGRVIVMFSGGWLR